MYASHSSDSSSLIASLRAIATKARPLSEYLLHLSTASHEAIAEWFVGLASETEIERRLDLWSQVVAKGDKEKFERRLVWDGLDTSLARLVVQQPELPVSPVSPDWTHTLKQVVETTQKWSHTYPRLVSTPGVLHRALVAERPIPFEELLLPLLQVAQEQLKVALNSPYDDCCCLLADDTQIALERRLIESLAPIFAPTLMQHFSAVRASGNALRDYLTITLQGPSKREVYQTFIQEHLQSGLLPLFEQYSVLARLAVTTIEFWVEATAEFIKRLQSDWDTLQATFSPGQPLTQVTAIQVGLSDTHNRGRSVAILTFDTGLKLVYKPKDLMLEVAFGEFINWCNQSGTLLDLKSPQVLNYSTHGWTSFITACACDSHEALQRFYRRSGMLMCLIHTLEGTDCHYENLIAHGEYPVLVDMETLFHPQIRNPEPIQSGAATHLIQQLSTSVLRTALLPQKELALANGQARFDMSGLGAVQDHTVQGLRWQHINTDGMTLDYEDISLSTEANVPILDDAYVSSQHFVDEIVGGFEQMYGWLMAQRAQLLSSDGPLTAFANQECRLVFRNTRTYAAILASSFNPQLLQSGIAYSVGLDVLSRAYLVGNHKPPYWPILEAEKQAIEQLDIPLLTANTSSSDLVLPNGVLVPHLFEASSFERVQARIRALSESDLAFQRQIIQLSFYSRYYQEPDWEPTSYQSVKDKIADGEELVAIAPSLLVEKAIAIAETLEQQAIWAEDGTLGWLGMGYAHDSQSFHIQGLDMGLYSGYIGVALFLSALGKLTQNSHWCQLATKLLIPIRTFFADLTIDNRDRLIRTIGIGGATGLGSLLYGLTYSSQWLQDPELLQLACRIARLISPGQISSQRQFDVVSGTAGYLLGLLSLAKQVNPQDRAHLLDMALACGQNLLDHQTAQKEGSPRAWITWHGQHLSGFSQGAAGIAYALLQLFSVTQDVRFLAAAEEAIAYEQTLFSVEAQNWLDLRVQEPKFGMSWAHGAPGIALARLGGLSVLDTDSIRQQITLSLNTTLQSLVWGFDSLCWGSLGRLEPLLMGAQVLHQPELLAAAHQATRIVLANGERQGGFRLFEQISPNVVNPGFFHGLSGIGYGLLRIAYPEQLPSILVWE